jgi:hypothetical protein
MARSAAYAPFHRIMGRVATGSGGAAQPPYIGPSFDAVGNGLQDARLPWNSAASGTSPQVIGWMDPGYHPLLDYVPATLGVVSIAAAAAGAAGPVVLVSSSGAGIIVSSSATLMFPSLVTVPSGTLFIDAVPIYRFFGNVGTPPQLTGCYDAATMGARAVAIHSAGNDSGGTGTVVGWDMYGFPIHQTVTLGSTSTVNTTKCFKAVASVTLAGTLSGSNVSVGVSDIYEIPFYCAGSSQIWGYWNNLILYGTGTFVAGVTSTASATTGDVRGTFLVGSASDGSKRLTLSAHPSISTMISAGVNIGMFGVAQF